MQGGFLCVEAGLTRGKNAINVAVKNLSDFSIALCCFWVFGFGLVFGNSESGLIGTSEFFVSFSQDDPWRTSLFIFQAMFCGTAVTIVSGAVAERMRFAGYLIITFFISTFVYPIIAHWVWGGSNGGAPGWLAGLGFVDFAGATVVHGTGGWAALAIVIVIGPRLGRFPKGKAGVKIPGSNLPLAMLGVILLWFGWIGFNGGSALSFNNQVPGIIGITMIGGCCGLLVGMIGSHISQGFTDPKFIINGLVAGLVSVTAGCHAINVWQAILIAAIGTSVMIGVDRWIEKLKIDDVVSAFPAHGCAGMWGTLAVGIFGDLEVLGTGLSRSQQVGVQCLGIGVCAVFSFVVVYWLTKLANRMVTIRITAEEELIGLNVIEHNEVTELSDLVNVMKRQAKTTDLSLRAAVEPTTEAGQIAKRYNEVIQSLEDVRTTSELIIRNAHDAIVTFDRTNLKVMSWNPAAEIIFGRSAWQVIGQSIAPLLSTQNQNILSVLEDALSDQPIEVMAKRLNGDDLPLELSIAQERASSGNTFFIAIIRDLSSRKAMEVQNEELEARLRSAQKLEAIGRLAAGVAHEMNTPIQFINDNTHFLKNTFADLIAILESISEGTNFSEIRAAFERVDVNYLKTEIPQVLDQSLEGLTYIAEVIRGMKEFSHPGVNDKVPFDVNHALETSKTVSINEWKYIADIDTFFDEDLPQVPCLPNKMHQVFLNLIINAAHAIETKAKRTKSSKKGTITLRTRRERDWVIVEVQDTGNGIPKEHQSKVFDPFFTTKKIGKGTGQGLAIVYSIITELHDGTIRFVTEKGKGTTLIVRLPLVEQKKGK